MENVDSSDTAARIPSGVAATKPTSAPMSLAIACIFAGMACFRLLNWDHHYVAVLASACLSLALLASTRRTAPSMARHLLRVTAVTTLVLSISAGGLWYSNHFPTAVAPVDSATSH